jgi:hypothetical protein
MVEVVCRVAPSRAWFRWFGFGEMDSLAATPECALPGAPKKSRPGVGGFKVDGSLESTVGERFLQPLVGCFLHGEIF